MTAETDCIGCRRAERLRLAPGEVARLLSAYLAANPTAPLADDATATARLTVCRSCPALRHGGTTCRHCGCLVDIRARLSEKKCPAIPPRW